MPRILSMLLQPRQTSFFYPGKRALCMLLFCGLNAGGVWAAVAKPLSYGKDILPVLSENCFFCHGQDPAKRKKDLRLDTLEGQRAKDMIVPGKPEESELIKRIFTAEADDLMPPADSHRALTVAQKELLKQWVAEGAVFEGHWAFSAPVRPALPIVAEVDSIRNPIDSFVLAKLDALGLKPSAEAPRETLIRRLSLDLTGLPPTLEEMDAYLADTSADAYEKVVDRLLASPHYGERMALPWLDAARYADSNGFQQDGDQFQWVWRDWVVNALNTNMPFDQFSIEQLAGDLLPNPTQEQLIATGFNRNHLLNGEGGAIAEEQRNVTLFNRVDTTATNWLGLTIACAQCHDHKYDPLTQKDYYSLMAYFNNVPETGAPRQISSRVRVGDPVIEVFTPEEKSRRKELEDAFNERKKTAGNIANELAAAQSAWEEAVAGDEQFPDKEILAIAREDDDARINKRKEQIKKYFFDKAAPAELKDTQKFVQEAENAFKAYDSELRRPMVMSDAKPRVTKILDRGNYEMPKAEVKADTPEKFFKLPGAQGNRLSLAQWMFRPEQPLTARVMVNRYWQEFFGQGLVKTSEDFGMQSEPPVHQELLDWLAVEFRESGWDVKKMHRLMVTSATYRQSSAISPALRERDPENRLYARATRFRLPAMLLRDQALATSGLLVSKLGGKPVYSYQPKGIWDGLAITKERDFTYPQSAGEDLHRRSLYSFWRRTVAPSNLFDASPRNVCKVRPSITNTPLHALTLLNDPTYVEAARLLAARVWRESGAEPGKRLASAFRRVVCRWPDDREQQILQAGFDRQLARFQADPKAAEAFLSTGETPRDPALDAPQHAALTAVCLGIFNLDEALTKP